MDKIQLTKFDDTDFAVWKFQVEAYLDYNDLLDIIDGTKKKPDEVRNSSGIVTNEGTINEWQKLDKKARLVIGHALEANIVRQVMNLRTAHEMWSRLESLYELGNPASKHLLLQRFYDYRMAEGASVAQHVAAVEEMARQLADMGHPKDQTEIVTKVLHSLPPSYRHLITAWDSVPEAEQTLANLLPRLFKEELMNKELSRLDIKDSSESSALYHKSGFLSGSSQTKKQKNASTKKDKFKGVCHYCGKKGHKKVDCYKFKNDQKANQVNTTTSDSNGGCLLSAFVEANSVI